MTRVAIVVALACLTCGRGHPDVIEPSAPVRVSSATEVALDTSMKARRRAVPAEVILRAYLTWFGGLAPLEIAKRERSGTLFDQWKYYLAAMGLPDYHLDAPRVSQSNPVMLAALGRLGEVLCIRSAEHDLTGRVAAEARVVFAFDPIENPSRADFAERFDVLHRTFLGYPASLAPKDRVARYFALHRAIVAHHATGSGKLDAEALGWVAVCSALVQHPETGLY